jgi:hypothetical protein
VHRVRFHVLATQHEERATDDGMGLSSLRHPGSSPKASVSTTRRRASTSPATATKEHATAAWACPGRLQKLGAPVRLVRPVLIFYFCNCITKPHI